MREKITLPGHAFCNDAEFLAKSTIEIITLLEIHDAALFSSTILY
jgi:hypothetical protein